jgi:signal-transduction protein with cAMP-binding, CBS, and nucleotidyltransferase domain
MFFVVCSFLSILTLISGKVYPCEDTILEIGIYVMQNMIFATVMESAGQVKMSIGFIMNRVSTFEGLSARDMELLKPSLEKFSCLAGTTVIKQGSPVDFLYLVLSGKVEVSFKPYDGNPITVTHVGAGGLFGWSAVVGSEKYTSSIIAIEDLVAVRIHGNKLRRLCVEQPESGRLILEHLANTVSSRWKDAREQVKSMLSNGMKNI